MQEKEFFQNYEINKSRISPMFQKVIAASVIIHIIGITVLSQVDLFQNKACDSPYIGTVCQVLDAAYVGSVLYGTDRNYVDKVYEKDSFEDADVTFIDVSNPPFTYPEGFFTNENTDLAMNQTPSSFDVNGNPLPSGFSLPNPTLNPTLPNSSSGGSDLLSTPQVLPTPSTMSGKIPESPFSISGSTNTPLPKPKFPKSSPSGKTKPEKSANDIMGESPKELPSLTGEEVAVNKPKTNKKPSPSPSPNSEVKLDENGRPIYEINRRPLKDYGLEVKELLANKTVDLNQPFAVTLNGVLRKDGKLDPTKTKYLQVNGDEKLVALVKSGIEALNASGQLQYLEQLKGKNLQIQVQQDEKAILVVVDSEFENASFAGQAQGALNFSLSLAKGKKKLSNEQNDKDELALLETAKIETQGKKVLLKFDIPRQIAMELIARKLKELEPQSEEDKKKK